MPSLSFDQTTTRSAIPITETISPVGSLSPQSPSPYSLPTAPKSPCFDPPSSLHAQAPQPPYSPSLTDPSPIASSFDSGKTHPTITAPSHCRLFHHRRTSPQPPIWASSIPSSRHPPWPRGPLSVDQPQPQGAACGLITTVGFTTKSRRFFPRSPCPSVHLQTVADHRRPYQPPRHPLRRCPLPCVPIPPRAPPLPHLPSSPPVASLPLIRLSPSVGHLHRCRAALPLSSAIFHDPDLVPLRVRTSMPAPLNVVPQPQISPSCHPSCCAVGHLSSDHRSLSATMPNPCHRASATVEEFISHTT